METKPHDVDDVPFTARTAPMTGRRMVGNIPGFLALVVGWCSWLLGVLFLCNIMMIYGLLSGNLRTFVQALSGSRNAFPAMFAMAIPNLIALFFGCLASLVENHRGKSLVRASGYLLVITALAIFVRALLLLGRNASFQ